LIDCKLFYADSVFELNPYKYTNKTETLMVNCRYFPNILFQFQMPKSPLFSALGKGDRKWYYTLERL